MGAATEASRQGALKGMLILKRRIAGIIDYRRVFFPQDDQLLELVTNLKFPSMLRVFSFSTANLREVAPIASGAAWTSFVDLSKGYDSIYAGMHASCRYKIRRAGKLGDRINIRMNTETARSDFFTLYNRFASAKGSLRALTPRRFSEYLPQADVFVLYFDDVPTCGRLVLRDIQSGTALMMYSATARLDAGADTITIGLLNRYLYWHEMKTYQDVGLQRYDFGGVGPNNPSATRFKMSFGGQSIKYYYGFYAQPGRIGWRLGHDLYVRWTGQTHDLPALETPSLASNAVKPMPSSFG